MNKSLNFSELNDKLLGQYRDAVSDAFPKIILSSQIIKDHWSRLEKYYPETQIFLVDKNDNLLGFINSIPIWWDMPLSQLPDDGWDWSMKSGIMNFEKGQKPNGLSGLQIIVPKKNQRKGISKLLIESGKDLVRKLALKNFIIPIRPTFKHLYTEMSMQEYMHLQKDGKIYDPWIRTHINSGAKINKVCSNAMNVQGDLAFWEDILDQKITKSGEYIAPGALNPMTIDLEKNHGEYREENIWISYT